MPTIIGLTGGIGSGKSRVAALFSSFGVPCYIADQRAKELMTKDKELMQGIRNLFGPKAYTNGELNRQYIGKIVFETPKQLAALNALVHPVVAKDFDHWLIKQEYPYVIKEVAILFETGGHKAVDISLLVTAPKDIRIARVMKRDQCTKDEVLARMANQWEDKQRIPLANYVIENIDWNQTVERVEALHQQFTNT